MIDRLSLVGLAVLGLAGLSATASADDWKIHGLDDGNIYTKPFTNLKGVWDQETGISAPLFTNGPWVFKWNVSYIQTYPLKFEVRPQWTAGFTAVYEFGKGQIVPGIYTKAKNNLQGLWQQETGFTARTKVGAYGLCFNSGYLFNYPRESDAKPQWQVGLSFQVFLK